MSNSKLDQVANLMYFFGISWIGFPNGMRTWNEMPDGDPSKEACRNEARSLIKLLREPTGAKTKAQRDLWISTIDAILNEEDAS